ncbi:MAG: hypothetical protein CHACPFDD_03658 [Phycisphaerae bacterium]|nr:hypothetical protein [Phycisphaerae bacterium]
MLGRGTGGARQSKYDAGPRVDCACRTCERKKRVDRACCRVDYDGDTDRLTSVNPGPGLPGGGAAGTGVQYVYEPAGSGTTGSNLVTQVNYKSGSSTTIVQTTRAFNSRGLIESVQNDWSGPSPTAYMASKYAYQNDALARRTSCVRTGAAFDGNDGRSAAHHDVWAYNDRNELTGSTRRLGTTVGSGDPVPGDDRAYAYDPIGNRTESTKGEDDPIFYCANELNQYEHTAATSQPCSTQPVEVFEHDDDGNLSEAPNGDGEIAPGRQVRYEWDAENRLIRVLPEAATPTNGDKKVEYTYD